MANKMFHALQQFVGHFRRDCRAGRSPRRRQTGVRGSRPCAERIFLVAALVVMSTLDALQIDFVLFGAFCILCLDAWNRHRSEAPPKGNVTRSGIKAQEIMLHFRASAPQGGKLSTSVPAQAARPTEELSISNSVSNDVQRRKIRLPKPAGRGERTSTSTLTPISKTGMGPAADVTELIKTIRPTSQSAEFAQRVATHVQRSLEDTFHGIEVLAYASSNIMNQSMYAGEVPDVDIVVRVSQDALIRDSQSSANAAFLLKKRNQGLLDETKLYKSVLRTCTDKLVDKGFKFVGSMFRGYEPNLQLWAPLTNGHETVQVPIVFGVNSIIPAFLSSLLATCNRLAPSAASLMFLVRRWVKDRNISYAPRGYLPPFHWMLLVVHFLQVRDSNKAPILPKFKVVKTSDGYDVVIGEDANVCVSTESPGMLFNEFVAFYNRRFSFATDLASITAGVRQKNDRFQPRAVHHSDGIQVDVAPTIEDPFHPGQALPVPMTWTSLSRTKQEFARADELCSAGVPLAELMTPWADTTDPSRTAEGGVARKAGPVDMPRKMSPPSLSSMALAF